MWYIVPYSATIYTTLVVLYQTVVKSHARLIIYFVCMSTRRPPSIRFYEEESQNTFRFADSAFTRFVKVCSFGLIKTDDQAGLVLIIIVVGCAVASYVFVQQRQTVPPTVTFELLPQESIGSQQGIPAPQPTHEAP